MGTQSKAMACAVVLVTVGLFGGTDRAEATPATLTLTGTLDGSFNSETLTDTAFTAVATLLSQNPAGGGYTVYNSTVTFDIDGVGIAEPITGSQTIIIGPPAETGYGTYGIEFDMSPNVLTEFFNARDSVPDVPGETLYSDVSSFEQSGPTLDLSLVGGGTVAIDSFESLDSTAVFFAPEPGSLSLLLTGLVAGAGFVRRRRRT